MIDVDTIIENKEHLDQFAASLTPEDVQYLVSMLDEKNDEIRYPSFLTLQKRSQLASDVYPYWDVFVQKLASSNSFQRNIGAILIAENVRWDTDRRFLSVFDAYMSHCRDEKFITSRLTIQSVARWIDCHPELLDKVVDLLISIDVASFKDSQRKLILTDIIDVLIAIRTIRPNEDIDHYLHQALTGGLLDKKSVKRYLASI